MVIQINEELGGMRNFSGVPRDSFFLNCLIRKNKNQKYKFENPKNENVVGINFCYKNDKTYYDIK